MCVSVCLCLSVCLCVYDYFDIDFYYWAIISYYILTRIY